jgi:hypothetical protein
MEIVESCSGMTGTESQRTNYACGIFVGKALSNICLED